MSGMAEATRLRDVVRGKDPIYGLCKERLITPDACDWLKSALDPFHDLQLDNLRGYPDVSTEPTVIVKIRQAVTVTKPEGLGDGENWDCHIVLSPIDYSPPCNEYDGSISPIGCVAYPNGGGCEMSSRQAGTVLPPSPNPAVARMDGLVINSVPSSEKDGANMTFTPGHLPRDAANGYEVQGLHLDDFLDFEETDLGVYRVIYSGFEVVNTTAQIAKQGAVTVYEYGNSYEVAASAPGFFKATSGNKLGLGGCYNPTTYFRMPPNTLAEAKIMPGAHSWAAQDGCYNTAKFQSENPFQALTKRNWILCQNETSQTKEAAGYLKVDDPFSMTQPMVCGSVASDHNLTAQTQKDTVMLSRTSSSHFSRMNTTGAYFTGLSSSTTLFVTWRVAIERLPAANKPTFLALAQPSAAFDPNALVLYNMIANVMPPGCPQGYNDAGTWYRWIQSAAKKSIPVVYPVIRTASVLAGAMGRPVLAKSLGAASELMRPAAEDIAVRRLQRAAKGMKQRKGQSSNGKAKQAVKNWSKPTMRGSRHGGKNGLG